MIIFKQYNPLEDKNMKNELAQVLNDFISLAKTHYDRKGNEYLLEQLEIALDKTNNNVQDAVNEARTTYQNGSASNLFSRPAVKVGLEDHMLAFLPLRPLQTPVLSVRQQQVLSLDLQDEKELSLIPAGAC